MNARTPPLGARVDHLEHQYETLDQRLERLANQLRRDKRETRKQIRDLSDTIAGIPTDMKRALNVQTSELKVAMAESETRNADRVSNVARQTPAWALITLTFVLTIIAGVIANWLLAAQHLPHIH